LKETITWLLTIERLASAFYHEVAERFAEDEKFSKFFLHLSGEEALHAKVIERASTFLAGQPASDFLISVDAETKEKIESPFIKNRELLSAGNLNEENVIDCLATTEFSEWNDIFVYVVKSLKEAGEFMPVSAKMQLHLKEIEQFMESTPEGRERLYIIKSLPRVWEEHILIIDDDLYITEVLSRLLRHQGHVEVAHNGREGLRKIREKYFDVIISDISMPVMDGIEFYRKASAYDPAIGRRIMFFSASPSHEHIDIFQRNNLRYLLKPAPLKEIVKSVSEILKVTAAAFSSSHRG
jgi:CheY-like chemotaxis protein